ncbi:ester cyclase [Telluribacter humicola]|uniref:ester cyclase n=1 Tax=Telluribacter humicola TaxID=1720261 RepID=UPI001A975A7D|nr:ester cyclase [Telluribacter humicola]
MSKQDAVQAQKQFGEAVNSGNLDKLREVVAPNAFDHDPAPGQEPGPEGYIQFFSKMRSAFPDMNIQVDQMVADEDKVAIAYTLTGTHKGNFKGIAATGHKISVRGVQIGRFENGQLVERWGSSDELGIMKQLGAHVEEHH